jgi:predicted DNA-binding protein (MmcQ/YjbR family)
MTIEELQKLARSYPSVTEDIKWGADLCFSIGGKMFLVVGLEQNPVSASFKVKDEDFDLLSEREGFQPAPYMARYKWIWTSDIRLLGRKEWEKYLKTSYDLIREKLPKKLKDSLK